MCEVIIILSSILTGNGERDHLAYDTANAVFSDALIAACVWTGDGLNFVKVFRGEARYVIAVFQPTILWLGEA